MANQMEALEAEQNHIDTRAGVVERNLRQLLETGSLLVLPLLLGGPSPAASRLRAHLCR